MKHLLKAQKGEMDAVLLYQRLASLMETEEDKQAMLAMAADEGKHAAILRKYTNQVVKGSKLKANVVTCLYKTLGRKKAFDVVAKGEYDSIDSYQVLVEDYPEIRGIMDDEKRHGDHMKELGAK